MRTIARIAALILVLLTCMPLPAQLWAAPATLPLAQADAGEIEARIAELYSRPPTIADHFRQDDGRWTVESSGDLAHSYQTSTYHLKVLQPQTIGWSLADASATNFYLEVDAFHTAGPIDNEYGVIFRYTDADNFYLFGASSDGYYIIQKVVDGEWSDLAEWTTSEAIHTGQQSGNTMGIFADGAQITALLNGEVVATLEDDSFSSGQIGLVAGTFDEANAEIAFDDLMLWDLDETPSTDLTPTPTPEVTTEPTAEVTATPESTDVAAQIAEIKIGDPLVSEDFRRDEGVWPTTSDENVAYSIKGRAYHILVKTANWLGFSFNTTIENQQLPDFLAEVAVTHASGPLDAEYGLLFHYQDSDNFYLYAVNGMGSYSLWKKVDGEWLSLIDWTETDALNPDEAATNHLALLVQAAQITLLINDTVIAQATDEASFSGTVGLVAGAFDKPEVEVAFDNFDLWALAGGTELPTPEITPTDEETATATPTATPEAEDISARLATIRAEDPTFADDFRRQGDWGAGEGDDSETTFAGRKLHIKVNRSDWMSWSTSQTVDNLGVGDFLAEADVEQVAGPENAEYGLVFHIADDENFYFFAISALGNFTLAEKVDGEWHEIIPWIGSSAIHTDEGAVNRLGVLAENGQYTLLVNDVTVVQVSDGSHSTGSVGVAAGTFEESGLEAAFDNFDLWVLSSSGPVTTTATPIATPTASPTANPTATPTATETPLADSFDSEVISAQVAALHQANPTFADDFRRDTGIWEQPAYDGVTFDFTRGAYRITVDVPNITPGSTGDIDASDFLLEVDAAQVDGPEGQYGLYFRQQDENNFYMFVVSPAQAYALWRMEDGEWIELIPWTDTDAITSGDDAINRLGVLAQGSQIALLVNDVPLTQITDETFASGKIALAAGTFDEGGVVVEFDNLAVWDVR